MAKKKLNLSSIPEEDMHFIIGVLKDKQTECEDEIEFIIENNGVSDDILDSLEQVIEALEESIDEE